MEERESIYNLLHFTGHRGEEAAFYFHLSRHAWGRINLPTSEQLSLSLSLSLSSSPWVSVSVYLLSIALVVQVIRFGRLEDSKKENKEREMKKKKKK